MTDAVDNGAPARWCDGHADSPPAVLFGRGLLQLLLTARLRRGPCPEAANPRPEDL
ncbi:hypothetical protein CHO01_27340 [Cellulomonas hominis]|uniref:Uncharacterized protein n=1 Tax=Cellulomonas hominis TaxID=156981 RepID=A0A511FIG8_9CELL|nr:hypothetical protein [Cellulomonas hominis]MBB5472846.1 hypothetical protein [Cellulomonas hominis]NKY05770.1 hypothetical protein [Cellulomonas hominis]NKY11206.1 hypothetical protein [Cellulomonas hominis]GEL47618.1 hypothetical protein CHO01_27340 [Cellulomonas hominis]